MIKEAELWRAQFKGQLKLHTNVKNSFYNQERRKLQFLQGGSNTENTFVWVKQLKVLQH